MQPISFLAPAWCRSDKGLTASTTSTTRTSDPTSASPGTFSATGKTALRGGYSLTYDVPNFATLASPYSLAGASAGVFTQPNLGLFSVSISGDVGLGGGSGSPRTSPTTIPAAAVSIPSTGVGDYICFSQGPVFGPSPTGEPPFDAYSVVQDFKTPRAHNYSLSIQQEIAHNNVLTVGYSGQRGQDLAINRDLNASPLGSGRR